MSVSMDPGNAALVAQGLQPIDNPGNLALKSQGLQAYSKPDYSDPTANIGKDMRPAEAQQRDELSKTIQTTVSSDIGKAGMAATSILGAIKDLPSNAYQGLYNASAGVNQAAMQGISKVAPNLISPQQVQNYTNTVNNTQQGFVNRGGNPTSAAILGSLPQAGLAMAAPGAASGLGKFLAGAGTGGALGAAQFDPTGGADRLRNTAVGAGIGGLAGGISATLSPLNDINNPETRVAALQGYQNLVNHSKLMATGGGLVGGMVGGHIGAMAGAGAGYALSNALSSPAATGLLTAAAKVAPGSAAAAHILNAVQGMAIKGLVDKVSAPAGAAMGAAGAYLSNKSSDSAIQKTRQAIENDEGDE